MAEKAAAPVKEEAAKVEKAEEKQPKTTKSKNEVKEVSATSTDIFYIGSPCPLPWKA